MHTRTTPKRGPRLVRYNGPPFDTSLLRRLIAEHVERPSVMDLARSLGKTHPTVARYLAGHDIPLSQALLLRALVAPGHSIEDLWRKR